MSWFSFSYVSANFSCQKPDMFLSFYDSDTEYKWSNLRMKLIYEYLKEKSCISIKILGLSFIYVNKVCKTAGMNINLIIQIRRPT